jgi:hypothetical protein
MGGRDRRLDLVLAVSLGALLAWLIFFYECLAVAAIAAFH